MQYQVGDLIRYDSKPPLYGILFEKSEIEICTICTIHWFNGIRNEYFLEELKYKNLTNLSRSE